MQVIALKCEAISPQCECRTYLCVLLKPSLSFCSNETFGGVQRDAGVINRRQEQYLQNKGIVEQQRDGAAVLRLTARRGWGCGSNGLVSEAPDPPR